jgi:glycosyltransferase involved in cell wall biosynthesis
MRLVHYYPRALVGDGGPTLAMWSWAGACREAGCDVAVICDRDLPGTSALRHPSVPVVPLAHSGVGRVRVPRGLTRLLRQGDVLVLHSTYVPGNVAAAWAARTCGVPYLVVPHGGYDARSRARRGARKWLWKPVERRLLERALAVHLFFESEQSDAAQVAPAARWLVAPTGFEMPAATWDGGSGGYLAWLGRYDVQHKGLDLLVDAMAHVTKAAGPPLRLHGKPSENGLDDVRALAAVRGVSGVVSVGGPVIGGAKEAFLREAAAYVHPSRWEAYSLALVEALAHGVPAVVSSSCAIAADLRQADAAVVVDPTPEAIARGVATVLRAQRHYSERALGFVQARLAWPTTVDAYLAQLSRLLDVRRDTFGKRARSSQTATSTGGSAAASTTRGPGRST